MMNLRKTARNMSRDERGNATIEFVIWFPVLIFLLLLCVDASQVFLKQAQATRIVQDANRSLSTGKLKTIGAAETLINGRLEKFSPSTSSRTRIDGNIITTVTTIPLRDIVITKILPISDAAAITIESTHTMEF